MFSLLLLDYSYFFMCLNHTDKKWTAVPNFGLKFYCNSKDLKNLEEKLSLKKSFI